MSKCSCCGNEMSEEEIRRFRKHKKNWQDYFKEQIERHHDKKYWMEQIKKHENFQIKMKGGERR